MPDSLLTVYRGELAALSAALIWAVASYVYSRMGKQLTPLVLNIAKSSLAIAYVLLTLLLRGNSSSHLTPSSLWLLSLSGAIGIGFGDTAFFASLNRLGPRRGLLLESLAPPLTALLALVTLQEQLSLSAWLGIMLTVGGVTWVVAERTPVAEAKETNYSIWGVVFGVLAALGQAIGAVLSRAALAETQVSPLWSTLIRLAAGVVVMLMLLGVQRPSGSEFKPLNSRRLLTTLAVASFASTFLAIWLQQTAVKYTAAGIAQSLGATSPLFAIPISLWLGDRITVRAVLGVLVALIGIRLLFL